MPVEIINQRNLKANAGQRAITVGEIRQFVAGLADDQRIDLTVHKGYHDPHDPREFSPDSITLTIKNPVPQGPVHRGGPWQGDVPVSPR